MEIAAGDERIIDKTVCVYSAWSGARQQQGANLARFQQDRTRERRRRGRSTTVGRRARGETGSRGEGGRVQSQILGIPTVA